jgi:chromosome segregation ATPase
VLLFSDPQSRLSSLSHVGEAASRLLRLPVPFRLANGESPMDHSKFEFDRDRFGAKYWVTPVRSFGKSSPSGQSATTRQKQTPLASPRDRDSSFSAGAASAFSPVTPREVAAPPAQSSKVADFLKSNAPVSAPQSPEVELAHVAMRCVALSEQLSSLKEQLREANEKNEGLEKHVAFLKESMIEAVNSRDAVSKQFYEYKESTRKMAEVTQRNTLLLKQQVQQQTESERAHNAQIARINAQHQEALDILREKLSAATSSSASHQSRATELSEALARSEAASAQQLHLLNSRIAACEAAEHTVQSFVKDSDNDFSVFTFISELLSLDSVPSEEEYHRDQLAARATAALTDLTKQRNDLLHETQSLKLELQAAQDKDASSRSHFEGFISELQRQLSACMSREAAAQARAAELSAELEETTTSSVAAISASACDIATLRSWLSESEAAQAALKEQLKASEFELNEVHTTLSHALQGDPKVLSATKKGTSSSSSQGNVSSSIEAELRLARVALQESVEKEALARSHIADCESKLASSFAVEAAARNRVAELEAASKLWDVFVEEHARKSQISVQLQSMLAAKSALLAQQEKELAALRQRVADCEENLAAAKFNIEQVEAANVALQEQLAGTCFELDEVHASLSQALEKESAAAADYSSKEAAWLKQTNELEAQLRESKAVEEAACNCVLELEAALKLNKESLTARCEELELSRRQVLEMEMRAAEQQQELDCLKHQLAESEISKISASDELITARSEVEVLMEVNNQLSGDVEALKSQISGAQSQISSLSEKLSSVAAEAESSKASLYDTSARESLARRKELEASAKSQALLEKLRHAEARSREMEAQLETQTEFAAASSRVSAAMREACSHSEILMAQMKKNLASSVSNEATSRRRIAELEAQLTGYESYFSQAHLRDGGKAVFGIGLFIVSMNVAHAGLSTPRSSPMTPGKKSEAR